MIVPWSTIADPLAELVGFLEVMRSEEQRETRLPPQLSDVIPKPGPSLRVEAEGRLVQEKDAREECTSAHGEFEAMSHAARSNPSPTGRRAG